MIDYDVLEDEFNDMPSREKFQVSMRPVGSLTDNARKIKSNRDGAHKRVHLYEQEGY